MLDILFEFMNFDSFWTLWFWVMHVVVWSMASHFAMGVPYDMVIEANREKDEDGPYAQAAEAMILAQAFRMAALGRRYGVHLTAFATFILTVVGTLAVLADLEFALALMTIFVPLTMIYVLTIHAAMQIDGSDLRGAALRGRLKRQRLLNQLIGLIGVSMGVVASIFEALRDVATFY